MQPATAKWRQHHQTLKNRDLTDRRRAMTLVELMLVLMLLTIIGSLAVPLLDGSFATVRLRRGTDQVLAAWARARTTAIETGEIYQFRFRPDESDYQIEPWQLREDVNEPTASDPTTDAPELPQVEEGLAATVVFASGRRRMEETGGERKVESLADSQTGQWSAPILFFPDGTTSSASILLRNERDIYQRATLRALTGVARSSELLSKDEADRAQPR